MEMAEEVMMAMPRIIAYYLFLWIELYSGTFHIKSALLNIFKKLLINM